ncbi:Os12g0536000 [Oryza sativa Japonica Group]|uniref:Os12g0536000 protein n=1 Tax=Oryza sativa subsp. japonica TaxID=39947 RepID=A0A0N7KU54_ORYSJ|nr:Os12g0536000 [Oryza sativa Japonica Group]
MAARRSRVAFVLVDGIGDVSIPSLRGRTPLEAAAAPGLDAVAAAGVAGAHGPRRAGARLRERHGAPLPPRVRPPRVLPRPRRVRVHGRRPRHGPRRHRLQVKLCYVG